MNLRNHTVRIAIIANCAALLTIGKLALSFIPNIEVVTLFIILFATAFGLTALPSVFVFCTVEMLLYGVNYWVIPYYIYWPLLCVVFILIRNKELNAFIIAAVAAGMTVIFGALTTATDALFLNDFRLDLFFRYFGIYYARGVYFFITHIVSNFIIVLFLYKPLINLLIRIREKINI
ncbi:MAG: hypothetical protein ACOX3U_06125 [Christensenellales bacterium]|jgi:energy-coupling factor transport system substrate-specific component